MFIDTNRTRGTYNPSLTIQPLTEVTEKTYIDAFLLFSDCDVETIDTILKKVGFQENVQMKKRPFSFKKITEQTGIQIPQDTSNFVDCNLGFKYSYVGIVSLADSDVSVRETAQQALDLLEGQNSQCSFAAYVGASVVYASRNVKSRRNSIENRMAGFSQ